jgi:prepilin-type N-terminal cleavage/methylation domain-containing protein
MNTMKGVTLVEMMIAVAVLGIVASLALPPLLDNVRKSRASASLSALSTQKLLVADAFSANGTLGCTDSTGAAIPDCSGAGQLSFTTSGVTVTLTPSAVAGTGQSLSWACSLTPASTPKIQGCGL